MPTNPVEFRKLAPRERRMMIEASTILAVFIQTGDAYGLMVEADGVYLSRDEKNALIRAARALPTRD